MPDRPKVGVSRCLLGDVVRYDGGSKPCAIVTEQFSRQFELIPVCPEVEAGLSIPRPPVQLTGSIEQPQLTGRDNPDIDITDLMHDYCQRKIPQLEQLNGFVFKSRSPSCGLNSTPVFIDGALTTESASGVFARAVLLACPDLPVIEETQLESADAVSEFIRAVIGRARWPAHQSDQIP